MVPFPQYPHISHVQAKLPGLGESAPSADIAKRPFPPPSANTGGTLAAQVQKLILTSVFLCPLSPHLSRCVIPPPPVKDLTFVNSDSRNYRKQVPRRKKETRSSGGTFVSQSLCNKKIQLSVHFTMTCTVLQSFKCRFDKPRPAAAR